MEIILLPLIAEESTLIQTYLAFAFVSIANVTVIVVEPQPSFFLTSPFPQDHVKW